MLEPLRGTKAHVESLLARCETAAQLVDEIAGRTTLTDAVSRSRISSACPE